LSTAGFNLRIKAVCYLPQYGRDITPPTGPGEKVASGALGGLAWCWEVWRAGIMRVLLFQKRIGGISTDTKYIVVARIYKVAAKVETP
jgi:hypothetical protein